MHALKAVPCLARTAFTASTRAERYASAELVSSYALQVKGNRDTAWVLAQLTTLANAGLACERITVEVGSVPGEAKFLIVGLGDTAVQESKQRVTHSIRSLGHRIPTGRVITVNLAPAHLRKAGARFDLPIALGLLMAYELEKIPEKALESIAFIGELALDGSLRHTSGILSAAIACKEQGIKTIVVPSVDGPEAALIEDIEVIAVDHLRDVVEILTGRAKPPVLPFARAAETGFMGLDFSDVRGQLSSKRALEIAAAGGHNVLLCGTPGSGKTLLARAFPGILPPLTRDEAIEVTRIYSVANLLQGGSPLMEARPFRVVHHTASAVSIVGGGQMPKPGEISLAHRGVLFLDELGEFPAQVLEVLRQPLEDRCITVTRAHGSFLFPADFTLIAAMNPPEFAASGKRTGRKISAPLLDRIDLQIDVQPVKIEELQSKRTDNPETSAAISARVAAARERQSKRFRDRAVRLNREMSVRDIDDLCPLDDASRALLTLAVRKMDLSARAYHRTIKVARTIADLDQSDSIDQKHIAEALQYRQSNRDS